MGCVYLIVFENGKGYIGISRRNAMDRWRRHVRSSDKRMLVARAFAKYGEKAATLQIIAEDDDWETLCALEIACIAAFATRHPFGYNMTAGGEGSLGAVWSEAARAKVSSFHKGRKKTEAECARISAAQRGVPKNWTPEWKANIKKALVGKTWSLGLQRSAKSKTAMAEKKRAWWASLTESERFEFVATRAAKQPDRAPAVQGAKKFWAEMSVDERMSFCARRRAKQTEKRREK